MDNTFKKELRNGKLASKGQKIDSYVLQIPFGSIAKSERKRYKKKNCKKWVNHPIVGSFLAYLKRIGYILTYLRNLPCHNNALPYMQLGVIYLYIKVYLCILVDGKFQLFLLYGSFGLVLKNLSTSRSAVPRSMRPLRSLLAPLAAAAAAAAIGHGVTQTYHPSRAGPVSNIFQGC